MAEIKHKSEPDTIETEFKNEKDLIFFVGGILKKIQGWCSLDKAQKLVETIVQTKPELCVEIGVFGGSSYIPQALALKHNKKGVVYGIDPWTCEDALEEMKDEANIGWWGTLKIEDVYKHCLKNIDYYQVNDYCKILRDKSENVVDTFEDESIDLLHIDGNHSEALSYKDAVMYLPKLKSGGHIFFDDIWWMEENKVTTRKAIVYLLEHCTREDIVEDCMILVKN
ncbi:MAG: class I SAM-dependent methyltransferase [Crenarchaeota archaeon]|nr:MAG: class I SAM-dependent methyltransferase [Thermoproteota archaeon]